MRPGNTVANSVPMLSMTGYGVGSETVGLATIVVEARAVNHRFLDVRVRFPPPLFDHAAAAEEIARKSLARGRIELSARYEGRLVGRTVLDRERARAALHELHELKSELGHTEPVPLSLLSAVPGLFVEEALSSPDQVRAAVQTATQAACRALITMREHEGASLAQDFATRLMRIEELGAQVAERIPELSVSHREKLRARIAALLDATGTVLDPSRLEQEVALIADRADVSEEITRLQSHCRQFAQLLASQHELVGRRLEFLLQEMGREVNTLGSKLTDLRVTACVLDLKAELERMREQVQNVL